MLTTNSIYESLIEQIKEIDTNNITDSKEDDIKSEIIEKQKVYFWIRLFLKEELNDLQIGDDFELSYKMSGESLTTKFIAFGKKNLNRDLDSQIVNYDPEDNKKILTLMVDSDYFESDDLPFIRTLFKTSSYYQFQVYKRTDLSFKNLRTGEVVEYVDCDF
jgi:hypothetical protein